MTETEPTIETGLVSLKLDAIEASTSSEDGDLAFLFKLPDEGLALRSAAIVDGTPELGFEASPKVPTIQEEDVAVAFRLVAENKRPGFFYTNFLPDHPLSLSRLFMQYSPAWLRWTKTGKLLADVDWTMKCMHIGTRTNESKTVFKSWSKSSILKELGTRVDFPKDGSGPTIMSCEYARVQKNDNEIKFPEEPKMKITDGCSSLYSKYITAVLPSIAYHDEPMFLKMQELVKLVLAVEWLYKEKGVRVKKEWLEMHTSKPADKMKGSAQCEFLFKKRSKPPHKMIPKLSVFNRPTMDVVVGTWEAEMNKALRTEYKVRRLYGYYDFGGSEVVMFKEDGTKCPPFKSLKTCFEFYFTGAEKTTFWIYLPVQEKLKVTEIRDIFLEVFRQIGIPQIMTSLPVSVSSDTAVVDDTDETTVKLKITNSYYPSPPLALPPLEKTLVVTASIENSSRVFASKDPNDPIQPEIPGLCESIIPDVSSWDELVSELSVPIPQVWMYPFYGHGLPSAWGGVTTSGFRVREEPLPTSSMDKRSEVRDGFRRNGHKLAVLADRVVAQGMLFILLFTIICHLSFTFFAQVKFKKWIQGLPILLQFQGNLQAPGEKEFYLQFASSLPSRTTTFDSNG